MQIKLFFTEYFDTIRSRLDDANAEALASFATMLREGQKRGRKAILVGNGGSAAIASHAAVDLTKVAGIRATNFNEASLLTCFANDYSYERWVEKALEFYADPGDVAVLISSSGKSANILNGAHAAKNLGLAVVTFSGFAADNPLRKAGNLNFWVDSTSYNVVEMTHYIWLLAVCDLIVNTRGGAQ